MSPSDRKKQLRAHYKALRAGISPEQKVGWDTAILGHLTNLPAYREAHTLIAYAPTTGEIDTRPLLGHAWGQGKRVALPYCLPGARGVMEFYLVGEGDPLARGINRNQEPDPLRQEKLTDFTGSICLVPGYAFDTQGFRLGYGGGYYDRFLSGAYAGKQTIGACYQACVAGELPREEHDLPCRWLITQTGIKAMPNS